MHGASEAEHPLDADQIRRKSFAVAFRGYEAAAVDAYLARVADELHTARQRDFELQIKLNEAERRLRAARSRSEPVESPEVPPAPPAPKLSDVGEDELTRLIGEETAHVLSTARAAATEIRERAEVDHRALLEEAAADIRRRREDIVAELERTRDDAEREAADIIQRAREHATMIEADARRDADDARHAGEAARSAALSSADTILDDARRDAERRVSDAERAADAMLVDARAAAEGLVEEARQARGEILADLRDQRDEVGRHLARLTAAREQLLAAFEAVSAAAGPAADIAESMLDVARAAADDVTAPASATAELLDDFLAYRATVAADEPADGDVVAALLARVAVDPAVVQVQESPARQAGNELTDGRSRRRPEADG